MAIVFFQRESKTTPQNYFLLKLSDLGNNDTELQITDFKHPQPDLIGITKELVQYKRGDGVILTANLYLPANYDGTPRPTLFWAYPREFKDAKAAGQVKGSKHRFVSAHWASPIHWAAKGWVIMDDFSLPVIGEGDAQPNDTFIEQLVSGATAAVSYVTDRGVCDPRRCAVGGHSYGAFMTAHLLSHTSLFAAGISRSGAFNRTLTPMSFQVGNFLAILFSFGFAFYIHFGFTNCSTVRRKIDLGGSRNLHQHVPTDACKKILSARDGWKDVSNSRSGR